MAEMGSKPIHRTGSRAPGTKRFNSAVKKNERRYTIKGGGREAKQVAGKPQIGIGAKNRHLVYFAAGGKSMGISLI